MNLISWRRQATSVELEKPRSRTVFSGELGPDRLWFSGGVQGAEALLEDVAGLSSAKVSRRDALKAMAVLRARNLIAGVSATIPVELRNGKRELDDRTWLGVQPDDGIEDTVTYAMTYEDLLFEATSYWRITRRGSDGYPTGAEHLEHRSVSTGVNLSMPSRNISQDLQFAPDDPIFVDGVYARPNEVIRFVSPNPPLLVHAAKAIRTILFLDQMASQYATNPLPFGYFQDDPDAEDTLDDDAVKDLLAKWERARRDKMWGYVETGMKLNMLEWPDPSKLQLAEARNHAVLDIARATGLDPEDLATVVEGTSRTYQNAEQRRLDMIDFTLTPYLSVVRDRLSMNDVTPRGLFAKHRMGAFARADTKSRFEAYKIAIECKMMTPEEARRSEDWPDFTPAQKAELMPKPPPILPVPAPASNGVNGRSMNGNSGPEPVGVN